MAIAIAPSCLRLSVSPSLRLSVSPFSVSRVPTSSRPASLCLVKENSKSETTCGTLANLNQPLSSTPMKSTTLILIAVAVCLVSFSVSAQRDGGVVLPGKQKGQIVREIPLLVDEDSKYLFYLHGRIVEEQGPKAVSQTHGEYQYEEILRALANKGFIVISEPRPKGTDVEQYAAKVSKQVKSLLDSGVPPSRITIVGASKGGGIAATVSSQLRNSDLNFVLLAVCTQIELHGNILSVWDYKDDANIAGCKREMSYRGVKRHREVELKLGIGHGLLYKPLKEWIDPAITWADPKK